MHSYASEWISTGAPTKTILRILGLKKSTYYKHQLLIKSGNKPLNKSEGNIPGYSLNVHGEKISDLEIQKYIMEIKKDEVGQFYGYRKVRVVLKSKYKLKINKKKVYRLMKSMSLLNKKKTGIKRYSKVCKNHVITDSNQFWEMDMKYVYIAETRQIAYLTSIIDVFDRSILAYDLSLSPNAEQAKIVVIKALYNRGIKGKTSELIVRTDNGSQFIASKFEKLCVQENITHERIPVHSPNYNAHIESYHRYLQQECLAGRLFKDLEDASDTIEKYVNNYNFKRIHSSIGYRTPNEFYNLTNSNFKDNLVISI
ncbi:IS3 family transposase [Clostridium sp. Marseille-Q7071]